MNDFQFVKCVLKYFMDKNNILVKVKLINKNFNDTKIYKAENNCLLNDACMT